MLVSLFMEVMVWMRSGSLKFYEHKMQPDAPKAPKDKKQPDNKKSSTLAISMKDVTTVKNGTENPGFTQS
jgi:hypothetical protein